jgi:hypothetical protein
VQLFMHTQKAINRGHPGDRLFVVHNSFQEGSDVYFTAWKCTLTAYGVRHPALKEVVSVESIPVVALDHRGRAANGSEPTAQFKKDSFYRAVSVDQLKSLLCQ